MSHFLGSPWVIFSRILVRVSQSELPEWDVAWWVHRLATRASVVSAASRVSALFETIHRSVCVTIHSLRCLGTRRLKLRIEVADFSLLVREGFQASG